jgi:GTP-binding protein
MRVGEAKFVAASTRPGQFPASELPEIAFAGRSNVGKSSLLNRLTGRRALARVSKTPGRTQQINFFAVGERFVLVDLPGYGYARVPKAVQEDWRRLVESYLATRRQLRAVVLIVDVRRGIEEDDQLLLDFLGDHGVRAVLVATKIDKVGRAELQKRLAELRSSAVLPFSSVTGEGMTELWQVLSDAVARR